MVASVMQTAGYKTGLFTSPHLIDFRERIRVNGEKIPETYVVDFVERFQSKWNTPSFFELTFGMALGYFADVDTEIVILETGMGGRLDSTNIIPSAEVCAVTNIGLDHMQFLGESGNFQKPSSSCSRKNEGRSTVCGLRARIKDEL
jgi:dihydrofolate synthase/folylpolyglutamate synthase